MFRLSALLAVLCLVASGCGVTLAPATGPAPQAPVPVVTLTFDDGRISDATVARMLNAHGLPGTFFINSGNVGKPGYLSVDDLRAISQGSNEIGGWVLCEAHWSGIGRARVPANLARHKPHVSQM